MKKVALAAALSVAATGAFAGTIEEPIIEPEIIVEETGTGGGILVPILLIVLLAAAVASADS